MKVRHLHTWWDRHKWAKPPVAHLEGARHCLKREQDNKCIRISPCHRLEWLWLAKETDSQSCWVLGRSAVSGGSARVDSPHNSLVLPLPAIGSNLSKAGQSTRAYDISELCHLGTSIASSVIPGTSMISPDKLQQLQGHQSRGHSKFRSTGASLGALSSITLSLTYCHSSHSLQ